MDEATHAISDACVTHREEIGFSYFVFGASVSDALAPVVANTLVNKGFRCDGSGRGGGSW
jgi:hypothetical protein